MMGAEWQPGGSETTDRFLRTLLGRLPAVPYIAAAAVGRETGLLSADEIYELERWSRLPRWIADAIDSGDRVGGDQSLDVRCVDPSQRIWHHRPTQLAGRWLPGDLDSGWKWTSPIHVVSGSDAVFTTHPFLKTCRTVSGYVAELTDQHARWLPQALEQDGIKPTILRGRSLVLASEGANAFAHWMLDIVPRLVALQQLGHSFDHFDNILLADGGAEYQRESLRRLRVPVDRLVECGRGQGPNYFHLVDEFVAVSPIRMPKVASAAAIACTGQVYPDCLQGSDRQDGVGSEPSVVYLPRGSQDRRRVVDESALVDRIRSEGIRVVDPLRLPLVEVASAIRAADIVIAPHGAAVTNMVFARPGTTLVEFYSAHLSPHFWSLATLRRFPYFAYQCLDDNGIRHDDDTVAALPFPARNATAMSVDVDDVLTALQAVTSTSDTAKAVADV